MDSSHLSASVFQTDMINLSDKPAVESDMNIRVWPVFDVISSIML
jgi:hypothetical protein